jgi:superfamily II DNA or RNA helicase
MLTRTLWSHNAIALDAMRESYRSGIRRMVISGPTGSGKTHLAAGIFDAALSKGVWKRVAFVVSNLSLIDQTVEAFANEGFTDIGVVQQNHQLTDWSKPVQIVSIQTAAKRQTFPDADVFVIDECHVLHKAHRHLLKLYGPKRDENYAVVDRGRLFIGLSATPYTKGLGGPLEEYPQDFLDDWKRKHDDVAFQPFRVFETLIRTGTTQEMIDAGILCPFRTFATGHPDMTGVKIVRGDFDEGETAKRMQQGTLTADIIDTYKKRWGKGKTLVFGVDCAHAQTLAARFREAGVRAAYQDASTGMLTKDAEKVKARGGSIEWLEGRREIREKFHSGEIEVVCNVGTLTTGTDWDVRCLILARPTRSEMLYKQIIGRALRTAAGKPYAIILDHSDTTSRLGFVTDIEYDELDDGDRKRKRQDNKKPLPKTCSKCAMLIEKKCQCCPHCGHEFKVLSPIIESDGELVEVERGKITMGNKGGPRVYTMREKAEFYAQLLRYQIDYNKSRGWEAHTYKAKFGVWPNLLHHVGPSDFITTEVYAFVKSRNIAYARQKECERHG